MPEERTCDYTGEPIEPGTGIMYVRSNGEVLHFVDSKAEKNYFLGREPRDLEWTAAGRAHREHNRPASDDVESEDDEQASDEDEGTADAESDESDDEDSEAEAVAEESQA